jgi:hypothetical protein
MVPD